MRHKPGRNRQCEACGIRLTDHVQTAMRRTHDGSPMSVEVGRPEGAIDGYCLSCSSPRKVVCRECGHEVDSRSLSAERAYAKHLELEHDLLYTPSTEALRREIIRKIEERGGD